MGESPEAPATDAAPEVVTELRALEWELSDVIRQLEVLREQVRGLQARHAGERPEGVADG